MCVRYIKVLHDRIRHLETSQHSSDQGLVAPVHLAPSNAGRPLPKSRQIAPKDTTAQGPLPPTQHALLPSPVSQVDIPHSSTNIQSISTYQNDAFVATPEGSVSSTLLSAVPVSTTVPHREASTTTALSQHGSDSVVSPIKPTGSSLPRGDDGDGASQFNAMGVMWSVPSQQQSSSQTFYGQSSVASLLTHIPSESTRGGRPEQRETGPRPRSTSLRGISSTPGHSIPHSSRRMLLFSLPPRDVADDLLNNYWSGVHLFYPWIHTQSFLKAYEAIWSPGGSDHQSGVLPRVGLGGSDCSDTVFNLALNAIFALGCEFSDSLRCTPQDPAREFIDRAFNLLHVELMDSPSLSLVQALLLAAFYLQSTPQVIRCWSMAGLACRMAQASGLHLTHHDSGYTELEVEMRRRAWHGCMLMDRYVTFGAS